MESAFQICSWNSLEDSIPVFCKVLLRYHLDKLFKIPFKVLFRSSFCSVVGRVRRGPVDYNMRTTNTTTHEYIQHANTQQRQDENSSSTRPSQEGAAHQWECTFLCKHAIKVASRILPSVCIQRPSHWTLVRLTRIYPKSLETYLLRPDTEDPNG